MADKTFQARAAFQALPYYYDKNLDSLMIHRCTVVLGRKPVSAATSYGHSNPDFGVLALRIEDIPCRLRPLTQQEQAAIGLEGMAVEDYYLYIPAWNAPSFLFDRNAAATCRIERVTNRGVLMHDGPFDIQGIGFPGGLYHHFLMRVRSIN